MKSLKIIMVILVAVSLMAAAGSAFAMSSQRLEEKKEILDSKVAEGVITQETSDEIYQALQECDGNMTEIGKTYGISFGKGQGKGMNRSQNGKQLRLCRNN